MEYEKIKKLMDDMGDSKLTEINIEFPDGIKISMKKNDEKVAVVDASFVEKIPVTAELQTKSDSNSNEVAQPKKEEGTIIKSPMVGTFYSKPSPTAESFVKVGKTISKGDVLCIIEAMKLMNEIEAEISGEIVEIIAKDGEPVEYGAPLFRVK